jgi:amino acid transporter
MESYGGYGAAADLPGGKIENEKAASRWSRQEHQAHHRSMGAKDPLMKKAHKKVHENSHSRENVFPAPSEKIMQLTALFAVPFVVYVVLLFMTMLLFHHSPVSVLMGYVAITTVCAFLYLVITYCTRRKEGKWKRWLGVYGVLAAFVGLMVGLSLHYSYLLFYYKYTNMMKYSNVAASQPALQFEDAGALMFTEGTQLDKARAVGFRHIRKQQTLCVAPVTDGQTQPTDPVVFFAVGTNCCGWRASFHCDDAGVAGTRGGLLMLEPNQLTSPAMEWMVEDSFDFKAFKEALDLQKAVFAVSAAKNYRFIKWVQDPDAKVDVFRKRGIEKALLSCLFYILAAGAVVIYDLVVEGQRQKAAAKAFIEGKEPPPEMAA